MKYFRVTQLRDKCIGCNACVEADPANWRMSKKDGKATLIGAVNKKGYFSALIPHDARTACEQAAHACPVKIIRLQPLPL